MRTAFPLLTRDLAFRPVNNPRPKILTPEQIAAFNEKGFIAPIDAFTDSEIEGHRIYFDQILGMAKLKGFDSYSILAWEGRLPGLYDLCTHPRILDPIEDIIGPNIVCWFTHYFCKLPNEDRRVTWHQDASFWPLSPTKAISVWLAIDDVDATNAPMQVIPRSHLHGQIDFERTRLNERSVILQSIQTPERFGDAPIPIRLKAGQISIHSDLIVHGSDGNQSDRRRCGLTLRYLPPDVRNLSETGGLTPIICRGHDPTGYWEHTPRPENESLPDSQRHKWRADFPENHTA